MGYAFQVQIIAIDGGWFVAGPANTFVRSTVEEAIAAARADFEAFVAKIAEEND